MKIDMPESVCFILTRLHENGHSAYIVGGCVRDALMGLTPSDWDITTSALPETIKSLFEKTVDTGLKHGTVTVVIDKKPYEVTTFRVDGAYHDARHPENVTFTPSLKEDLARRDFTVNAMAYNEKDGLIDLFSGRNDLKNNILTCVGNPDIRFKEDALRMLRAVRFCAQKGFMMDDETNASIKRNASLIQNLSAERIWAEFSHILLSDRLEYVKTLYDFGILSLILPALAKCFETTQNIKWHIYDVGIHSVVCASNVEKKPYLRFAALLHDIGKPLTKGRNEDGSDHFRNHAKESVLLAEEILNQYKVKNSDKDKILRLIKHHDREIIPEKKYVKRAVNAVGDDIFLDLMALKRADALAQNTLLTAPRLLVYEKIVALYEELKTQNEPFSVKHLKVDGNDLKAFGLKGKEIGDALSFLLDFVIENPEKNEKEILLKKIKGAF